MKDFYRLYGIDTAMHMLRPGARWEISNNHFTLWEDPRPCPSWVNLDPNTLDWIPPVPEPASEEGKIHIWDELTRTWITKVE